MKQISLSPEETRAIALKLIESTADRVFCLYGELGAGKTAFIKGIAEHIGIEEKKIKSPTFTILREHPLKEGKLFHYDFYRPETADFVLLQQLEENILDPNNYVFIEWADRIIEHLPNKRIDVFLEHGEKDNERIIKVKKYDQ